MKICALTLLLASCASAATHDFDVVVYGGTAGGVIAAVSSVREGLRTALLEPSSHLGGMVSSGLGNTDLGKKEAIGGYAFEFYQRIGSWQHEPHIAEETFRQMLTGAGVKVFERNRLKEKSGVHKIRNPHRFYHDGIGPHIHRARVHRLQL